MADVNVELDTRDTANKVLAIIYIIAIVVVNAGLVFKIVRRHWSGFKFMYDQKQLTLISLAIGDIFLALFNLVVQARILFDSGFVLSCSEYYSAIVYGFYLLPFVFSTSLVALAVELTRRLKRHTQMSVRLGQSCTQAFITSAVPWFLGLVIVLPLTMWTVDWHTCILWSNMAHLKSMSIVSICIPASVALLAGVFVMFVKPNTNSQTVFSIIPQSFIVQYHYDPSTNQMQAQSLPAQNQPPPPPYKPPEPTNQPPRPLYQPSALTSQPLAPPYQYQPATSTNQPLAPINQPLAATNLPQPPPYQPPEPTNQPLDPNNQPLAPTNQPPPPPYQPPSPTYQPPAPTHQPFANNPQPSATTQTSAQFFKEKRTLLLVCIVHFICVIPFAGFEAGYSYNPDRKSMNTQTYYDLGLTYGWLLKGRSIATPLMWLLTLGD